MSLLHNAKKHFILAIVFVLAISALNAAILLNNKTWARTYIDEERSALAKIIVGRMYGCISGYTASDKNYLGNTGHSSDPNNKKAILEGKYPTNLNRITSSIYNNKEIENIAAWVIAKLAGTKVESDSGWVQCTTGSVFKWSLNALKFLNDGGTYNAGYWDNVRLDFLKPQFEFYYKAQGGNLVGNKISDEDLQSYYANDEVSMRVNVDFETLSNWLKTEFPNLDLFGAPSNAEKYWIAWHTADGYMTENEGFTCSGDAGYDLTYAQNSGYITQRTINPNTGEEEDCYVPSYKHDTLDYTAYYAKTNGDIAKVPDISDHDGDDIANDLNSYVQAAKNAISEKKSQQLKDKFKADSETYKQDCVNKYNTWKDSWKKSIYPEFYNRDISGEYFREDTKKKQLLDAFNEAVDNYESAHSTIYYEDLDLQSYNALSADRDITFTFGVRVYVIKRGELDNRCFIDAFEDAIETNYKKKEKEILERIAAEENKEKAKNLKTACAEMFDKWLDAAYEANGLNVQEWHQGSGYGYSQEIMAKRNELVKTVTSSFGAAATSRIDWTSYVYREPGASYEIPHYDENGNYLSGQIERGTADKDVGVCKACAYIDNASKTLKRKGYAVPEIGEGTSCTNPTVEASHPDNIWTTPSIQRDDDDIPPDLLIPIDFQLGMTGDDTGYEGGNYEPDSCYSNSASLGWIVCPLVSAASAIGETMWDHIETYHLKLPANALFGYTQGQSDSGVHIAWGLIRNIANLAFIVIFLVIIVSQVSGFGINNYGIKKMLPKLIICVLLVNLSFIICQIVVDLSNTIGSAIGNFLGDIASKIPWNIEGYAQSDGTGGVSTFINIALIGGAAGGLFALIMSIRHGDGFGSLVGALGLFVLGIVIVIVVAIATLYITLIIREAAIVICITIAPLAIVCNVLPNTESLFKKWLSLMKALLVLYPVSSFVIGGGHLAAAVLASTGINTMKLAGSVVEVIPYFFIPSLLKKSLAGIGNVGARLGALGKSMGHKASNGAKNGIRNSRGYQDMLAGSKAKAKNRYEQSTKRRLDRRKARRGSLSVEQEERLAAANKAIEDREKNYMANDLANRADRIEARRLENRTGVAMNDEKLMGTWGRADANDYANAQMIAAREQTRKSVNEAMNYNNADFLAGLRLENDLNNIKNRENTAAIGRNAGNYAAATNLKNQIERNKQMQDINAIAANAANYQAATELKNNLDREKQMEDLNAIATNAANYQTATRLKNELDRNKQMGDLNAIAANEADYRVATNLKNSLDREKQMGDLSSIARNATMYENANRLKNNTEREAQMDKLATSYGGAQYDDTGNVIRNGAGEYAIDANRADQYARGVRSFDAISNRKDAADKINQAEHSASLFQAAAIKSDIDRDNQTRTARAFSEDMDRNGNFVSDPGAGPAEYRASDYVNNYETTERNKNYNTLASGHTAPIENTFAAAKASHQQSANSELLKSFQTEYANMSTNELLKQVDDFTNGTTPFDPRNTGQIQRVSALVSAAIKSKNEGKAQALFDKITASGMDLSQVQEFARSVDAGDVAGIKAYQSAVLNAQDVHSYSDFVSGKNMGGDLSLAGLAEKKDGGVTTMDADTIVFANDVLKQEIEQVHGPIPAQKIISGKQALHNILSVNKDKAQNNMSEILDQTDYSIFDDVQITGAELTSKLSSGQLNNLKKIADNNAKFRDKLERIVGSLTPEKRSSMDPNQLQFLEDNFGKNNP